MNNSQYSHSQITMTAGASTIKGKVNGMEETIKALIEEINFYKKEVQTLRSEKEALDDTMTRKCQEIRQGLTNDVMKAQEDMRNSYMHTKSENNQLQTQVTQLKVDKTNLQ